MQPYPIADTSRPLLPRFRRFIVSPCSRTQQRLDRAALVHRAVALRHLIEWQHQVEDFPGVDLSIKHQLNQLGEEAAHRRGATVKMDVRVEQLRAIEVDSVRDADVADRPARARGSYRLHHRLGRADTFQHGVRTHALGQLPDAFTALVSAPGPY